MTTAHSRNPRSIPYSSRTLSRAERAVRCAPFRVHLFASMRWQSVDLKTVVGAVGVHNGYTHRAISELVAENELMWLIQIGLLRREVDGQGLTDSFRLTPLGRQLVEKWERQGGLAAASWRDRLLNALSRWLRLPSWLQ